MPNADTLSINTKLISSIAGAVGVLLGGVVWGVHLEDRATASEASIREMRTQSESSNRELRAQIQQAQNDREADKRQLVILETKLENILSVVVDIKTAMHSKP